MSRCWPLALRCGKFVVQQVVELLRSSLSVGGVVHVRSRCPCSGVWALAFAKTYQVYSAENVTEFVIKSQIDATRELTTKTHVTKKNIGI